MNIWARYAVGFFVLVLVMSALVFTFGPREYREAFRSEQTPVGQLPSDAQMENVGESAPTTSGATTSSRDTE